MDPAQIPLRDLHLPAEIGWWPLAPAWWVLITIASAAALCYLWLFYRRWRADRGRRIALRELAAIEAQYAESHNAMQLAKNLSELLRRALLAYAPRKVVAGLTGDQWLTWLDQGLDEAVFAKGHGRLLGSLPYRSPEQTTESVDVDAMIEAVRLRLTTPLPEGAG